MSGSKTRTECNLAFLGIGHDFFGHISHHGRFLGRVAVTVFR
jgi:hypothetical protein